ncbi:hypothetical protein BpHYR1_009770 [Brachionus plicatilis]|uniref:Uncharacterized protein n=1 Tax=Brachionus plicatilis TaxID=10195 RepID=A0A3M7TAJ6_BRAPC|nr:hypothetical protein BpHYR1_009770 [Brachionus plicatilis]
MFKGQKLTFNAKFVIFFLFIKIYLLLRADKKLFDPENKERKKLNQFDFFKYLVLKILFRDQYPISKPKKANLN